MPATCDESQDQHTSQEYGDKCESRRNVPKKRVRKSVPRANARRGRLDVLTKRRGLFFTNAFRLTIWQARAICDAPPPIGRTKSATRPLNLSANAAKSLSDPDEFGGSAISSPNIFSVALSKMLRLASAACRRLASRHTEVGIFWCDPVASTLLNSLLKW